MKKKYNPFKMWGSYIGIVFFIVLLLVTANTMTSQRKDFRNELINCIDSSPNGIDCGYNYINCPLVKPCLNEVESREDAYNTKTKNIMTLPTRWIVGKSHSVNLIPDFGYAITVLGGQVIFYFLIGWGIHSLFRRFA